MKKTTKLIALLTLVAVLIGLVTLALADDKIYTSPTFKFPKERIISDPLIPEVPEEEPGTEPEVTEEPGTEPAETTEPTEATEPAAEPTETTEPAAEPTEATEPAAEPTEATEPAAEPTEATEPAAEPTEATEPVTEPEPEKEPEAPAPVERKVMIYSSRKEVVTEGDIIELTGALIGFEDVPDEAIAYQWQVDRNDGAGWVDVDGATKWYYKFIANKETILYNWRLIVTVND